MNNQASITPRESLDIHEIMMFKVLCGTKAATMNALIQDEELKNMMQLDVTTTKEHLNELKELLITSDFAKNEKDNL